MVPKPRYLRPWSALVLTVLLALSGCAHAVGGAARPAAPDPGFFFAGPVPTYGQTVSPTQQARLAYLRAVRRVDPCDLLTRAGLSRVGELGSVGTLFSFDECDVDIKVPGDSARRYVSVSVELATLDHGRCEFATPLLLSRLPGAPPLPGPVQPVVRIMPITDQTCDFADRVGRSATPMLDARRPPIRDGAAAYPVALAERDPCEILQLTTDARWDIGASRPYVCALTLSDGTAVRLTLQPQLFEPETDTRSQKQQDGVELFVDTSACEVSTFVGAPMRRKLLGGDYLRPGDVVIRPAVAVQTEPPRCETAMGIAVQAAKLFG